MSSADKGAVKAGWLLHIKLAAENPLPARSKHSNKSTFGERSPVHRLLALAWRRLLPSLASGPNAVARYEGDTTRGVGGMGGGIKGDMPLGPS